MSDYVISITEAISPLILIACIGYIIGKKLSFSDEMAGAVNKICFYVLIPASLLKSMMTCDLKQLSDLKFFLLVIVGYVILIPITTVVSSRLIPARERAGSFSNAIWRSNTILVGLPIAEGLIGSEGYLIFSVIALISSPLFNTLSILQFSYFSSEKKDWKKNVLKNVIKNPLIIAIVLGAVLRLLHLDLPPLIFQPVVSLSASASPVSMLLIGIQLSSGIHLRNTKLTLTAIAIKLVLQPLIFTSLFALLGYRGSVLGAVYLAHALPTAVQSGIIAEEMHCDGAFAHEIVLVSTVCSVVTLFIGGLLLRLTSLMV